MAVPATRSALNSRTVAVRTELAELSQGAHTLAGGLDTGTADQKRFCDSLAHHLSVADKSLRNELVTDAINGTI